MLFEGGGQSCHQKRTQSTTLLLAGLSGEAQILDRMEKAAKRAAERTIEKRVERGTEKAINKTIDKGVDGAKRDTSSTTTSGTTLNPFANKNVKAASSYSFTTKVTMLFERPKEDNMDLVQYTGEGAMMIDVAEVGGCSIIDWENNVTITLMEEDKSAFIMSMDRISGMVVENVEEEADMSGYTFVETGRTKQIIGYTCNGYQVKDNETGEATEALYTDEVGNIYAESMYGVWNTLKIDAPIDETMLTGMLMKMTHYDKKGKQDFHLLVTGYEKVERVVNMND